MIDISNIEVLTKYLFERKLIDVDRGYSIRYCDGGVSCTVAFVYDGDKPIIVKQGLAQLKVKEKWLCDQNRMDAECRSNEIFHELLPDCAPEVFFYDKENYICGREAVPESWRMWKDDLMDGIIDEQIGKLSMLALSIVHNKCAGVEKIKNIFASKDVFYNLRISPYFEFLVEKYPSLSEGVEELKGFLMGKGYTLIHGDFSPKNIMTDGKAISILDYEVAHYGHPSFDLGFLSTHFVLKAVKFKSLAGQYLSLLRSMLEIYFDRAEFIDRDELMETFRKVWAMILLARVDGKSPAEYITVEEDKELIRTIAFYILACDSTYDYKKIISECSSRITEKKV